MSTTLTEWIGAAARRVFGSGMTFHQTGFHGDQYLIELVNHLAAGCDCFIETGTNAGSSLAHMARTHPQMRCLSCEPDPKAFAFASENTAGLSNVELYNENAHEFLNRITEESSLKEANVLFWLDAHGYGFEWPLREEIARITAHWDKALILIDDFLVPGLDCFKYDEYNGQVCSYDYIKESLNPDRRYRLYYPQYTDKTSTYHPLKGWGLIEYGHAEAPVFPEALAGKIKQDA